jgi:hypothetical protein
MLTEQSEHAALVELPSSQRQLDNMPAMPELDFTALTAQLPAIQDLGGVNIVLNTQQVFQQDTEQLQHMMQLAKNHEDRFHSLKCHVDANF